MSRFRTYVLTSLALMLSSTVILFSIGESRLDVYYSISTLIYLITVELLLPVKERYRRRVYLVEAVLVSIFFIIVAFRVAEILGWRI